VAVTVGLGVLVSEVDGVILLVTVGVKLIVGDREIVGVIVRVALGVG
jgi:hypothetical protein